MLEVADKTKPPEQAEDNASERAAVRQWQKTIKADKIKWEPDFKRMRENMEFVAGIQHEGQSDIRDSEDRYIVNLTLRIVMGMVAQLYARNPTAEAVRRKRLDFAFWDGSIEQLTEAFQGTMQGRAVGIPNMEAEVVMQDFMNGKKLQQMVDKVCKTLEIVYQYQVDAHKPDYKEQMKQAVVRAITCGVAYCIPSFVREHRKEPSTTEVPNTMYDRAKLADLIMEKLKDDKIQDNDPQIQTLKSLMLSIGASQQTEDEYEVSERIEFDWPQATSIIPDSRCRNLREFVGGRHVTQEFIMPLEEVNAFFGLLGDDQLKLGGQLAAYTPEGQPQAQPDPTVDSKDDPSKKPLVALWRVMDSRTKTHFFIADGHKKYIVPPEPLDPCVAGFWPVFALTFNNIETESECKVSIFPPSVVDIIRDPQKEWNRTREALRGQRNANAPTYLVRKGTLTPEDKDAIQSRQPNEVIELVGVPSDKEPGQIIQTLQVAKIDPAVYDVNPLEQDIQLGAGSQQADIGPAQPDVTATVGNIAEQARLQVTSSNADDLDGFLSRIARASGEMMLRSMDEAIVKQIAGPGAVWPQFDSRKDFLNMVELTIRAASSGRPNQALKARNAQQLVPLLLQLGANPVATIEYVINTLDDQLDPQKFFPVPGQALATATPQQAQQTKKPSKAPPQQQEGPPPSNVIPMTPT